MATVLKYNNDHDKSKERKEQRNRCLVEHQQKKKKYKKRLNSKKEVKNELFSMLKCTIG